jgi:LacI family transcriptional regulator
VAAKEQDITIEIVEEPSNQDGSLSLKNIVKETLTGQSSIDGIISCTVMTTVHLLLILSELGKNVGSDIDVCAKERFPFFSLIRPDVLTVREDLTQAGSFLAKAALHAIEHPKDPPLQLLVTPEQEDNVQINPLLPEHP